MLAVVSYALSYAGAVVSYRIVSYRIASYRIVSYRIVSYPGSVSWRTFHYGFLYVQSAKMCRAMIGGPKEKLRFEAFVLWHIRT